MENNKRPRRNSGRGILEVHPTQLRRGEAADIKPEQLHIIDIDPEQRVLAAMHKEQAFKKGETFITAPKNTSAAPTAKTQKPNVQRQTEKYPVSSVPHKKESSASAAVKTEFVRNTGLYTQTEPKIRPAAPQQYPSSARIPDKSNADPRREQSASRDAEKEKKARNTVNAILCTVFASILVLGAVMSLFHMSDKNKPVYSEYEKRPLEQMPEFTVASLADGTYTRGVDSFFSDNFPMRESLVKNATLIKRFKGVRAFNKNAKQVVHGDSDIYSDGEMEIHVDEDRFTNAETIVIHGLYDDAESGIPEQAEDSGTADINTDAAVMPEEENAVSVFNPSEIPQSADTAQNTIIPEATADTNESVPASPEASDDEPAGELKGDKRDTIYIMGDTAYEYFRGTTKSSDDYIKVINTYAKYIPENVNIYTLVIPTHPEFGLSGADRTVSNDQKPVLEYIGKNLDARVKFIDPYANLLEAYNKGEYIYYRTDHHWTIRGAYCAYLEFCETAGIIPVSSDSYEKGRVEPFLGTFYSASGREQSLADNPDYVEYFVIDTPCTVTRYDKNDTPSNGKLFYRSVRGEANGYLAFMGGDFPYAYIKTENTNGKKLMIFKESFANPLIGLLAPHYEEIHVADIRYFKYNSINFIKQYGITDVLFCNGIMSANSKARVNDLVELMNK